MSESIIVALITGGLALIGVWLTNRKNTADIFAEVKKNQAVTDTKLDELTREVRRHNEFAERIPTLEEKAKAADRRLTDLEHRQAG